jgi:hypothetical protein
MINETTHIYLQKKLKIKKSNACGFEGLSRETGTLLALQLVYIWQLINLMAAGCGHQGITLNKTKLKLDNEFDPIDLTLCLLIQEFHDNDEEYFSLNIMKSILSAYEIHMDNVTLGIRLKKLVSSDFLEQSKFKDLSEDNKKLISNNNRIQIIYRLHPLQKEKFNAAYLRTTEEDFTFSSSDASPLCDYTNSMKKALLLMPDDFKQDFAEELVNSIAD